MTQQKQHPGFFTINNAAAMQIHIYDDKSEAASVRASKVSAYLELVYYLI